MIRAVKGQWIFAANKTVICKNNRSFHSLVAQTFKFFFRAIFHFRSPQASIIKLVWLVEAIFWKKPEVRGDFTIVGTPKACVANDFRPRVKTSLWPSFWKWILAPTKAILGTFDFQRCKRAPYFVSRSEWLDTIKYRWAGLHFEIMLRLPRIPIGHEQGNSGLAKLAPMKRL